MKIKKIDVNELDVHELANLTPTMTKEQFEALKNSIEDNGQLEPVRLYHGLIVDGRHRLKALKELGATTIQCIEEDPKQSISDMREKILRGWEMRRHQTPTQLAITAMKEYLRRNRIGERISQGQIAEEFGIPRMQLARALKLYKLAGSEIIDILHNGGKINIGTEKPKSTDSLATLISVYEKLLQEKVENSKELEVLKNIADERKLMVEDKFDELKATLNEYEINYLTHLLIENNEFKK